MRAAIKVLEGMADKHVDLQVPYLESTVRTHLFFDISLNCGTVVGACVLLGTEHYSMLRFWFIARSIVRSELASISLLGLPVTQQIVSAAFRDLASNM